MLRDHPHITDVTQEFTVGANFKVTSTWIVFTDLVLDALSPHYKIGEVQTLIKAVVDHCKRHPELVGRMTIRGTTQPSRAV